MKLFSDLNRAKVVDAFLLARGEERPKRTLKADHGQLRNDEPHQRTEDSDAIDGILAVDKVGLTIIDGIISRLLMGNLAEVSSYLDEQCSLPFGVKKRFLSTLNVDRHTCYFSTCKDPSKLIFDALLHREYDDSTGTYHDSHLNFDRSLLVDIWKQWRNGQLSSYQVFHRIQAAVATGQISPDVAESVSSLVLAEGGYTKHSTATIKELADEVGFRLYIPQTLCSNLLDIDGMYPVFGSIPGSMLGVGLLQATAAAAGREEHNDVGWLHRQSADTTAVLNQPITPAAVAPDALRVYSSFGSFCTIENRSSSSSTSASASAASSYGYRLSAKDTSPAPGIVEPTPSTADPGTTHNEGASRSAASFLEYPATGGILLPSSPMLKVLNTPGRPTSSTDAFLWAHAKGEDAPDRLLLLPPAAGTERLETGGGSGGTLIVGERISSQTGVIDVHQVCMVDAFCPTARLAASTVTINTAAAKGAGIEEPPPISLHQTARRISSTSAPTQFVILLEGRLHPTASKVGGTPAGVDAEASADGDTEVGSPARYGRLSRSSGGAGGTSGAGAGAGAAGGLGGGSAPNSPVDDSGEEELQHSVPPLDLTRQFFVLFATQTYDCNVLVQAVCPLVRPAGTSTSHTPCTRANLCWPGGRIGCSEGRIGGSADTGIRSMADEWYDAVTPASEEEKGGEAVEDEGGGAGEEMLLLDQIPLGIRCLGRDLAAVRGTNGLLALVRNPNSLPRPSHPPQPSRSVLSAAAGSVGIVGVGGGGSAAATNSCMKGNLAPSGEHRTTAAARAVSAGAVGPGALPDSLLHAVAGSRRSSSFGSSLTGSFAGSEPGSGSGSATPSVDDGDNTIQHPMVVGAGDEVDSTHTVLSLEDATTVVPNLALPDALPPSRPPSAILAPASIPSESSSNSSSGAAATVTTRGHRSVRLPGRSSASQGEGEDEGDRVGYGDMIISLAQLRGIAATPPAVTVAKPSTTQVQSRSAAHRPAPVWPYTPRSSYFFSLTVDNLFPFCSGAATPPASPSVASASASRCASRDSSPSSASASSNHSYRSSSVHSCSAHSSSAHTYSTDGVAAGASARMATGHSGDTVITHLDYAPASQLLVSADNTGCVCVWKVRPETGKGELFCAPLTLTRDPANTAPTAPTAAVTSIIPTAATATSTASAGGHPAESEGRGVSNGERIWGLFVAKSGRHVAVALRDRLLLLSMSGTFPEEEENATQPLQQQTYQKATSEAEVAEGEGERKREGELEKKNAQDEIMDWGVGPEAFLTHPVDESATGVGAIAIATPHDSFREVASEGSVASDVSVVVTSTANSFYYSTHTGRQQSGSGGPGDGAEAARSRTGNRGGIGVGGEWRRSRSSSISSVATALSANSEATLTPLSGAAPGIVADAVLPVRPTTATTTTPPATDANGSTNLNAVEERGIARGSVEQSRDRRAAGGMARGVSNALGAMRRTVRRGHTSSSSRSGSSRSGSSRSGSSRSGSRSGGGDSTDARRTSAGSSNPQGRGVSSRADVGVGLVAPTQLHPMAFPQQQNQQQHQQQHQQQQVQGSLSVPPLWQRRASIAVGRVMPLRSIRPIHSAPPQTSSLVPPTLPPPRLSSSTASAPAAAQAFVSSTAQLFVRSCLDVVQGARVRYCVAFGAKHLRVWRIHPAVPASATLAGAGPAAAVAPAPAVRADVPQHSEHSAVTCFIAGETTNHLQQQSWVRSNTVIDDGVGRPTAIIGTAHSSTQINEDEASTAPPGGLVLTSWVHVNLDIFENRFSSGHLLQSRHGMPTERHSAPTPSHGADTAPGRPDLCGRACLEEREGLDSNRTAAWDVSSTSFHASGAGAEAGAGVLPRGDEMNTMHASPTTLSSSHLHETRLTRITDIASPAPASAPGPAPGPGAVTASGGPPQRHSSAMRRSAGGNISSYIADGALLTSSGVNTTDTSDSAGAEDDDIVASDAAVGFFSRSHTPTASASAATSAAASARGAGRYVIESREDLTGFPRHVVVPYFPAAAGTSAVGALGVAQPHVLRIPQPPTSLRFFEIDGELIPELLPTMVPADSNAGDGTSTLGWPHQHSTGTGSFADTDRQGYAPWLPVRDEEGAREQQTSFSPPTAVRALPSHPRPDLTPAAPIRRSAMSRVGFGAASRGADGPADSAGSDSPAVTAPLADPSLTYDQSHWHDQSQRYQSPNGQGQRQVQQPQVGENAFVNVRTAVSNWHVRNSTSPEDVDSEALWAMEQAAAVLDADTLLSSTDRRLRSRPFQPPVGAANVTRRFTDESADRMWFTHVAGARARGSSRSSAIATTGTAAPAAFSISPSDAGPGVQSEAAEQGVERSIGPSPADLALYPPPYPPPPQQAQGERQGEGQGLSVTVNHRRQSPAHYQSYGMMQLGGVPSPLVLPLSSDSQGRGGNTRGTIPTDEGGVGRGGGDGGDDYEDDDDDDRRSRDESQPMQRYRQSRTQHLHPNQDNGQNLRHNRGAARVESETHSNSSRGLMQPALPHLMAFRTRLAFSPPVVSRNQQQQPHAQHIQAQDNAPRPYVLPVTPEPRTPPAPSAPPAPQQPLAPPAPLAPLAPADMGAGAAALSAPPAVGVGDARASRGQKCHPVHSRQQRRSLFFFREFTRLFGSDNSDAFQQARPLLGMVCVCFQPPSLSVLTAALDGDIVGSTLHSASPRASTDVCTMLQSSPLSEVLELRRTERNDSVVFLKRRYRYLPAWLCCTGRPGITVGSSEAGFALGLDPENESEAETSGTHGGADNRHAGSFNANDSDSDNEDDMAVAPEIAADIDAGVRGRSGSRARASSHGEYKSSSGLTKEWAPGLQRVGQEFWVDPAVGHNLLCALYLKYCGNKSVAMEHSWQDYLRIYGPSHLRRSSRGLRLLTEHVRKIDETSNIRTSLPRQIGYIVGLYEIYARRVGLMGRIPNEIGELKHLRVLSMGNNHLSGELPASLGRLQNMQRIVLHQNNLRGRVPSALGRLGCIVNLAGNPLLWHGEEVPVEERLALEDLYAATGGHGWVYRTNWCSDRPVAKWYKVSVRKDTCICTLFFVLTW